MSHKGTLLVVDDNRLVLAALCDGLTRAGYAVLDADNGDDAILLAREHRPELALLDIRMEGKSGFDVASYLRTVCRTPFLFLSAFADDQTVARVKALGAVDYLVKPLEIGQIVAAVDAAFERIRDPQSPGGDAPARSEAVAMAPDSVAIATGVLMHRYSLRRADALAQLRASAEAAGRSLEEHAQRTLTAIEDLAPPPPRR